MRIELNEIIKASVNHKCLAAEAGMRKPEAGMRMNYQLLWVNWIKMNELSLNWIQSKSAFSDLVDSLPVSTSGSCSSRRRPEVTGSVKKNPEKNPGRIPEESQPEWTKTRQQSHALWTLRRTPEAPWRRRRRRRPPPGGSFSQVATASSHVSTPHGADSIPHSKLFEFEFNSVELISRSHVIVICKFHFRCIHLTSGFRLD